MRKTLSVVAAIIENENQEILCALRSPTMSISNHWEFPGGKIQKGENPAQAIEREINEELKCTISAEEPFCKNHYDYETFSIDLTAIKCRLSSGFPEAHEHSKILWLKRENVHK